MGTPIGHPKLCSNRQKEDPPKMQLNGITWNHRVAGALGANLMESPEAESSGRRRKRVLLLWGAMDQGSVFLPVWLVGQRGKLGNPVEIDQKVVEALSLDSAYMFICLSFYN